MKTTYAILGLLAATVLVGMVATSAYAVSQSNSQSGSQTSSTSQTQSGNQAGFKNTQGNVALTSQKITQIGINKNKCTFANC
jgi:tetrahydromethanopterin S-methyltransferase subunit E